MARRQGTVGHCEQGMLTPSTTFDIVVAQWTPWSAVAFLMQFGYIVFGFAFSPSCSCCTTCGSNCTSDNYSQSYQIDISGASSDGICSGCTDLNGSWEVVWVCYTASFPARCHFANTSIPAICDIPPSGTTTLCGTYTLDRPSIALALSEVSVFVTYQYTFGAVGSTIQWTVSKTAPYDCQLSAQAVTTANTRCNANSATVTVTAL